MPNLNSISHQSPGIPALVPLPQGQPVFGLSRSTTYRAAADGLIELRKIGSRTYIVSATALAYIAALPTMRPRQDPHRKVAA
jgi:hypothetical protein